MELTVGDKLFHTRLTRLQVPTEVVGHCDKGHVELEYHQYGVRAINHRCPMYSISFGIPCLDSTLPSLKVPPDVLIVYTRGAVRN